MRWSVSLSAAVLTEVEAETEDQAIEKAAYLVNDSVYVAGPDDWATDGGVLSVELHDDGHYAEQSTKVWGA